MSLWFVFSTGLIILAVRPMQWLKSWNRERCRHCYHTRCMGLIIVVTSIVMYNHHGHYEDHEDYHYD